MINQSTSLEGNGDNVEIVHVNEESNFEKDLENTNVTNENEMNEMLDNIEDELVDQPERFERVSKAADTPLYPGYEKYSILSGVLALYNLKAKGNWSDSSFDLLLELLGKMFPDGKELPTSTYYAKKLMCPLGLDYERIHACPNDCILYRNEYAGFDECPICGVSRYKPKHPKVVEVGKSQRKEYGKTTNKKGAAAKVLWHLPIIHRFKRLYANSTDAQNLR